MWLALGAALAGAWLTSCCDSGRLTTLLRNLGEVWWPGPRSRPTRPMYVNRPADGSLRVFRPRLGVRLYLWLACSTAADERSPRGYVDRTTRCSMLPRNAAAAGSYGRY